MDQNINQLKSNFMKQIFRISIIFFLSSFSLMAQEKDAVVEAIIKEANENSQLKKLGHELMDVVGPRLVGTPQMKQEK